MGIDDSRVDPGLLHRLDRLVLHPFQRRCPIEQSISRPRFPAVGSNKQVVEHIDHFFRDRHPAENLAFLVLHPVELRMRLQELARVESPAARRAPTGGKGHAPGHPGIDDLAVDGARRLERERSVKRVALAVRTESSPSEGILS